MSSGPPTEAGGPSTSGGGGVGQYKRGQPRKAGGLGKCGSADRGRGVAEYVSMKLAERKGPDWTHEVLGREKRSCIGAGSTVGKAQSGTATGQPR